MECLTISNRVKWAQGWEIYHNMTYNLSDTISHPWKVRKRSVCRKFGHNMHIILIFYSTADTKRLLKNIKLKQVWSNQLRVPLFLAISNGHKVRKMTIM